jgi:hypothetical protein
MLQRADGIHENAPKAAAEARPPVVESRRAPPQKVARPEPASRRYREEQEYEVEDADANSAPRVALY